MANLLKTQALQGQRALVVGANSGFGPMIAEALADAGSKVMINYLGGRDKAEHLAECIRAKEGLAMIFQADVSQESQIKSMFDVFIAYWGGVDILVNLIGSQNHADLGDMSLEQWNNTINVNLGRQFLSAREAAREFLHTGDTPVEVNRIGKIISISLAKPVKYAGSEDSVSLLMKVLAQEFAKDNIRVNGITPSASKGPEKNDNGISEDIAKTAVWLAINESNAINGETFYVENGMIPFSDLMSA